MSFMDNLKKGLFGSEDEYDGQITLTTARRW